MVIFGLGALLFVVTKRAPSTPVEAATIREPEKPWLSRETADQIIGPNGTLGPLFAGITLGGPTPSPATRARIAAFARANDVHINFEVADDELVAIRFDVMFGGCCGYEGVDALGARIGQAKHWGGCGEPTYYYNNWAMAHEDGTHVRGKADVNRLSLRWERTLSFDEVLKAAERVLGADRGTLGDAAGDRWIELEPTKRYLLEMPYWFAGRQIWQPSRSQTEERGLQLVTDRRIVTEVKFQTLEERPQLKKRWGKPRVTAGDDWVWYRGDRTIVAGPDTFDSRITIITISKR